MEIVILLPMFAVMYFLLIRPQQKKLKQQREMQAAVAVGDEVVTSGGMFGIVTAMDDADIWLEVSEGVDIRFARGAILRVSRRAADEPDDAEGAGGLADASADALPSSSSLPSKSTSIDDIAAQVSETDK
jgi:preprotein translocase subunit YajC